MHHCKLCQFRSKYKWIVNRHAKSKHKEIKNNNNKSVLLCGNCELITTCVDEMIRHKKDEHNIIYSKTSLEQPIINGGEDKGGGGKVNNGGVGVDEEDVIKERAWNHPSFRERGYDSYF